MRFLSTVALALVFVAGCDNPLAPVVDDLAMPSVGHRGADGVFNVQGLLSFHRGDLPIVKVRVTVQTQAGPQKIDFPVGDLVTRGTRGTFPFAVHFGAESPRNAPFDYTVQLVDEAGRESAATSTTVTLP